MMNIVKTGVMLYHHKRQGSRQSVKGTDSKKIVIYLWVML